MARWLALGILLLTGCALDVGGLGEATEVDGGGPAHTPLAPQPEAGGSLVIDSGSGGPSTVPDTGTAVLDGGGPSAPDPVGADSGGDPGGQDGDDSGDQGPGKGNGHHG